MQLDFNGYKVPVRVSKQDSTTSKHTGSLLEKLEVQTTIRGRKANDEFLSLMSQARTDGVVSVDAEGKIQKKWKVANSSWSYREGEPNFYHTLEIEEMEDLHLASLTIGNLTIQPYKYEEHFTDDALAIEAKVALSVEQHAELKAMQKTLDVFSVVRHGISEEPKQMLFGICYWSKHDTGFKHELQLFEERKESKPSAWGSTLGWMFRMPKQVASTQATVDALLNALLKKNALTEEEIVKIRDEVSEHSWDVQYELFRVKDIDK